MKKHAHTLVLLAVVIACFAYSCKSTTGSSGSQSIIQWLMTAISSVVVLLLGADPIMAVLMGFGAGATTAAAQDRVPIAQPGGDAPCPSKFGDDPIGWFDRLLDLLMSGLWLALVLAAVIGVLWRYRKRIVSWIQAKKLARRLR